MTTQTQQPQQHPTTANQIYQPTLAVENQLFGSDLNQQKYKRIIHGLAIAVLVLGSICVLLAIIVFALIAFYPVSTIGEGIWCGAWIIVAGALGVSAAKINSPWCMINCHLAFSIVGAVFSGVLFLLGVMRVIGSRSILGIMIFAVIDICSFSSMVLLIISASYSCALSGCCNQTPGHDFLRFGGQVMYPSNTVTVQSGTNMQVFQPTMPDVQFGYVQQPAVNQITQEPFEHSLSKEQEALVN